jgi:sodium-coupled neutral amino acid transporter 11
MMPVMKLMLVSLLVSCIISCQALGVSGRVKLSKTQAQRFSHALRSTLEPSLDARAPPDAPRTATVTSSTFSLAKGILGAGLLTLPSGIASFSDKRSALVPATFILAGMGLLSAYSFKTISGVCKITESRSLNEAWCKSVNKETAPWVSFIVAFKTVFTCITYSIVIGELTCSF